jgi:hypothetical protein
LKASAAARATTAQTFATTMTSETAKEQLFTNLVKNEYGQSDRQQHLQQH